MINLVVLAQRLLCRVLCHPPQRPADPTVVLRSTTRVAYSGAIHALIQSSLEGSSTQYSGTLAKTIPLMAFGTRVLEYWILGPSGLPSCSASTAGLRILGRFARTLRSGTQTRKCMCTTTTGSVAA